MIPVEAVEAALVSLLTHYGYTLDEMAAGGPTVADEREHGALLVTTLLEAAAPYMMAEAWDRAASSIIDEHCNPITPTNVSNPYRSGNE